MPRKTLMRYLGLDFGNSNSKVCYTVGNEEGFDTPPARNIRGTKIAFRRWRIWMKIWLLKSVGNDVHSTKDRISENDSIQGEIKLRLMQDDEIAVNCMQAISKKFADELKEFL